MRKSTITVIVYALGLMLGAVTLDLWRPETNIIKSSSALLWTVIFLITLFYTDNYEQK